MFGVCRQSQLVEKAVNELVGTLRSRLKPSESVNLTAEEAYTCLFPDHKHKKARCQECQPCCYYALLNHFTLRNSEALVKSEYQAGVARIPQPQLTPYDLLT